MVADFAAAVLYIASIKGAIFGAAFGTLAGLFGRRRKAAPSVGTSVCHRGVERSPLLERFARDCELDKELAVDAEIALLEEACRLTTEQAEEVREEFLKADHDQDGKITAQEALSLLRSLGMCLGSLGDVEFDDAANETNNACFDLEEFASLFARTADAPGSTSVGTGVFGDGAHALDEAGFLMLLRRLVGETRKLQSNPYAGTFPEERRAADIVLDELSCFAQSCGPLEIKEFEFQRCRTNLWIKYKGEGPETVAFLGAHFDVVPPCPSAASSVAPLGSNAPCNGKQVANSVPVSPVSGSSTLPSFWNSQRARQDGSKFVRMNDKLVGRGTSSGLGHVALLTQFLSDLARERPRLQRSVVVVFFAAYQGGEAGIGGDELLQSGALDDLKGGPVFWIDGCNSRPCIGSLGWLSWTLKVAGQSNACGVAHRGANSIQLAAEAVTFLHGEFARGFPVNTHESLCRLTTGAVIEPTGIELTKSICDETIVWGIIRVMPMSDVQDIKVTTERLVADFNERLSTMGTKEVPTWAHENCGQACAELKWLERPCARATDRRRATWGGTPQQTPEKDMVSAMAGKGSVELALDFEGVAINRDSVGHRVLLKALRAVRGHAAEFIVNRAIPHIRRYQRAGFDVQLCGFGRASDINTCEEYCSWKDMQDGYQVILRIVGLLESQSEEDLQDETRQPAVASTPKPRSPVLPNALLQASESVWSEADPAFANGEGEESSSPSDILMHPIAEPAASVERSGRTSVTARNHEIQPSNAQGGGKMLRSRGHSCATDESSEPGSPERRDAEPKWQLQNPRTGQQADGRHIYGVSGLLGTSSRRSLFSTPPPRGRKLNSREDDEESQPFTRATSERRFTRSTGGPVAETSPLRQTSSGLSAFAAALPFRRCPSAPILASPDDWFRRHVSGGVEHFAGSAAPAAGGENSLGDADIRTVAPPNDEADRELRVRSASRSRWGFWRAWF